MAQLNNEPTTLIGDYALGGDPLLISNSDFRAVSEGRKTHFKGFLGACPSDGTDCKIRYDGKFWPEDTMVHYPDAMRSWRKTMLAFRDGDERWRWIEDRCDMDRFVRISAQDARRTAQIISFSQPPPPLDTLKGIEYYAPIQQEASQATMNKSRN